MPTNPNSLDNAITNLSQQLAQEYGFYTAVSPSQIQWSEPSHTMPPLEIVDDVEAEAAPEDWDDDLPDPALEPGTADVEPEEGEEFVEVDSGFGKRKKKIKVPVAVLNKTKLCQIFKYRPVVEVESSQLTEAIAKIKSMYEIAEFKPKLVNEGWKVPRNGDTFIGLEIEIENCTVVPTTSVIGAADTYAGVRYQFKKGWRTTVDGSLRHTGVEFITNKGIRAKDLPEALVLLELYLKGYYSARKITYRCGTHIHLDVRNMTLGQYLNMLFLYVLFEDLFYLASGNRRKNNFCVPIRESYSMIESLVRLTHMKKPTKPEVRRAFEVFKKYMAYNLRPTGCPTDHNYDDVPICLGTVEFRHHRGTSDASELVPWMNLALAIHDTAQQCSFEEMRDLIFNLNSRQNYVEFAERVFGEIPNFVTRKQLIQDMYNGSLFLKQTYINAKEGVL